MEIFAHRGASGDHPENTLIAIERAIEFGAHGIEIDLQLVDGQIVVFHDRWLHKTTNGQGLLQQQTFEQLRALKTRDDQQIPILLEVLECIRGRCLLNIELKHKEVAGPALATLDFACKELGFSANQFIVSSFHHRLLAKLKHEWPQYQYAGLTASVPLDLAAFAERIGCSAIHIDMDSFDEELLQDAHQRGLKVRVYTVDQPEDIQHLATQGADGVFSNFPARAIACLQSLNSHSASNWVL